MGKTVVVRCPIQISFETKQRFDAWQRFLTQKYRRRVNQDEALSELLSLVEV